MCICSGTPGASNYLLAIFFMNLTIYGIYYCAMKQINGEKINKIPLVRFLRSLEVLLFHEGVILLIVLCRFYCCYFSNYSMKVYACLGLICFVPSLYFFTKVSKVFLSVKCPSWQRNMKINCVSSFTVPLFQKEKSTESSPSISRYNSLKDFGQKQSFIICICIISLFISIL